MSVTLSRAIHYPGYGCFVRTQVQTGFAAMAIGAGEVVKTVHWRSDSASLSMRRITSPLGKMPLTSNSLTKPTRESQRPANSPPRTAQNHTLPEKRGGVSEAILGWYHSVKRRSIVDRLVRSVGWF